MGLGGLLIGALSYGEVYSSENSGLRNLHSRQLSRIDYFASGTARKDFSNITN